MSKRNQYPSPPINETLDRLCKVKYFTQLGITAPRDDLHIAEGDDWKTAHPAQSSTAILRPIVPTRTALEISSLHADTGMSS